MPQEQTVCLDPADFLAFQVREYKTFGNSQKAQLGMPILGNGSALGYIYTADELRKNVAFLIEKGVVPGQAPPKIPSFPLALKPRKPGKLRLL
jgi:hypothetical protein